MFTYCVDRDTLAVILPRKEFERLLPELRGKLCRLGAEGWADMEGEFFCGEDEILLIARPLSPLCGESSAPQLRLDRRREL